MALFEDAGVAADVVTFIGGAKQSGGDPATASFSINSSGAHTSLTGGQGSQWETENNPTPVDSYHIKWEDADGPWSNPTYATPFAKSTWTALSGSSGNWSHRETSPDISTRGFRLFISNDGGSTTLEEGDVTLTADATP